MKRTKTTDQWSKFQEMSGYSDNCQKCFTYSSKFFRSILKNYKKRSRAAICKESGRHKTNEKNQVIHFLFIINESVDVYMETMLESIMRMRT